MMQHLKLDSRRIRNLVVDGVSSDYLLLGLEQPSRSLFPLPRLPPPRLHRCLPGLFLRLALDLVSPHSEVDDFVFAHSLELIVFIILFRTVGQPLQRDSAASELDLFDFVSPRFRNQRGVVRDVRIRGEDRLAVPFLLFLLLAHCGDFFLDVFHFFFLVLQVLAGLLDLGLEHGFRRNLHVLLHLFRCGHVLNLLIQNKLIVFERVGPALEVLLLQFAQLLVVELGVERRKVVVEPALPSRLCLFILLLIVLLTGPEL
mmetsp:Transcript_103/g.151  ORF Transcript_103/g.151 Transcript_103/m.151 type:complete len:258 (-) Transcript_103:90-863(-)